MVTNLGVNPLHDDILFVFEEQIKIGIKSDEFIEKTDWGFTVTCPIGHQGFDETAKKNRWGIVIAIGPEIKDQSIIIGSRIYIEALKWTPGVVYKQKRIWKTNEKFVLLIDDNA